MHPTIHILPLFAGVLLGSKAVAQISYRFGLPAVFGELLFGLLIGPSVLGWLAPSETLNLLANIGVIVLMFLAGLETDVVAMRQVGKTSLLIAAGGVLLPLGGGLLLGTAFGLEWQHGLFLGTVLTATSVSISAQTLRELGQLRSGVGTTILSAAVIDDVLGVVVFALALSLAGGGNLLLTLGKMILFFPIAWGIGNWLVPILVRWEGRLHHREASLALLLSLMLIYAWAADVLGSVATITGAYLLGIMVARHAGESHIVHDGMAAVGYAFFIPIFFINIGLQAQATGLLAAPLFTSLLIVWAIASKIIGCGGAGWLSGLNRRAALQIGCGMVSRGEVALVIAGAGLAGGLLDSRLFSILVVVTLVTTLVTPPLLRLSYAGQLRNSIAKEVANPL